MKQVLAHALVEKLQNWCMQLLWITVFCVISCCGEEQDRKASRQTTSEPKKRIEDIEHKVDVSFRLFIVVIFRCSVTLLLRWFLAHCDLFAKPRRDEFFQDRRVLNCSTSMKKSRHHIPNNELGQYFCDNLFPLSHSLRVALQLTSICFI